jgi:CRISPR-associated protein Csh2
VKDVILQNSDFLFGFEAVMTNPNGDPDQENRPRMDYETATTLVSDARRKRGLSRVRTRISPSGAFIP